jgi:TonB family protein
MGIPLSRLQPHVTGHKLFFMNRLALLLCLLTALAAGGRGSKIPQNEVVLISLAKPVYPQLAKQARVVGDVELKLSVRADGTVESTDVMSGPGMLRQAALASAQQSKFECRHCNENANSYQLTYKFELVPMEYGPDCEIKSDISNTAKYPEVIQSQNNVTLTDYSIGLCDPGVTITRVRSAKCLYLWKCGHHW